MRRKDCGARIAAQGLRRKDCGGSTRIIRENPRFLLSQSSLFRFKRFITLDNTPLVSPVD
jgi:hypothetical protein